MSLLKPAETMAVRIHQLKTVAAKSLLLALGVLVMVSCEVAPIVHLINVSCHNVRVRVLEDDLPLPAGQEVEFSYPYSANGGMSIWYAECVLTYMPPPPPTNGYMRGGAMRGHLNLRLGSNWSVAMLPPSKGELIAAPLEVQPEGFPLLPTKTGNCD